MGKAGLILLIAAAMAVTHPTVRRRAAAEARARLGIVSPWDLSEAEADFRAGDYRGSRIQDFWTADVVGLYSPDPPGHDEWLVRLLRFHENR
jgi:hypothetical protein